MTTFEGPYNLLFYTFMILMFLFFEFNKGLECSKSPMKTNLLSFNLSNERISFLLSLLIVIYSLFFSFSFPFPLPCNFCL